MVPIKVAFAISVEIYKPAYCESIALTVDWLQNFHFLCTFTIIFMSTKSFFESPKQLRFLIYCRKIEMLSDFNYFLFTFHYMFHRIVVKAFECIFDRLKLNIPQGRTIYMVRHMFINWSVNVSFISDYSIHTRHDEYTQCISMMNPCKCSVWCATCIYVSTIWSAISPPVS